MTSSKLPAGLELAYSLEIPPTPFDAFVLSLHWSIIRCGLLVKTEDGDEEGSERLPAGWWKQEGSNTVSLFYQYRGTQTYELKVIELTKDDMIAVTLFHKAGSDSAAKSLTKEAESTAEGGEAGATRPVSKVVSGTDKNSAAAATFQLGQFVRLSAFEEGKEASKKKARVVYENADGLEKEFYANVMAPLGFTCDDVQVPKGPYDTKAQDEEKKRDQSPEGGEGIYVIEDRSRGGSNPDLEYDPLGRRFVPPPLPQLGRSDLDPLGRLGAGNIMDPRGMRGGIQGGIPPGLLPGMPGGLPPGARFDPFGPIDPLRPDRGARPNPDHARPHNYNDYDDMFM